MHHDLLWMCVHTPHQPGGHCGGGWGGGRISTEAQEAQVLWKKTLATPGLLSAGHYKHKTLGLVFLQGKDMPYRITLKFTQACVPQFWEWTVPFWCKQPCLLTSAMSQQTFCFPNFYSPGQVSVEWIALLDWQKISTGPCELWISLYREFRTTPVWILPSGMLIHVWKPALLDIF